MKTENLTGKYAQLIALHKEMPKRKMADLPAIGPGGTTTGGQHIDNVYWMSSSYHDGANHPDDKAGFGIQYDDWFVFVSCRNFAYFEQNITGWTQKVTAGTFRYDSTYHSINLGDESAPNYGFAAAVYKR